MNFMKYTKERGYNIYAYEFGNELVGSKGIESHFSASDYFADWKNFIELIDNIYRGSEDEKPLTVMPDNTFMDDWYSDFLELCKNEQFKSPDIVTHHLYSLGITITIIIIIIIVVITTICCYNYFYCYSYYCF